MPSFQYWSTKAQSWEFIENRFRTDFGGVHRRMIELVQYIQASGLATRLFAFTSMDKLVISIDEMIVWHKEALHITFDLSSNQWRFEYFATPYHDAEFVRIYPGDKGIEKFDKFLKMIRW